VNDVALAILAGMLGRYLRQQGHRTEGVQLRDMVTTSVPRREERGTLGNHVGALMVPRPTLPQPELPRVPGLPKLDLPQPVMINIASANIRGPQNPLYLAGHRLRTWHTAGTLGMNVGLFVVMLSYNNQFSFSVTVDPKLVPDEWTLIDHFHAAVQELQQAAGTTHAPAPARRK
jgi:hypothetical protein